jgi:hypothetical protein
VCSSTTRTTCPYSPSWRAFSWRRHRALIALCILLAASPSAFAEVYRNTTSGNDYYVDDSNFTEAECRNFQQWRFDTWNESTADDNHSFELLSVSVSAWVPKQWCSGSFRYKRGSSDAWRTGSNSSPFFLTDNPCEQQPDTLTGSYVNIEGDSSSSMCRDSCRFHVEGLAISVPYYNADGDLVPGLQDTFGDWTNSGNVCNANEGSGFFVPRESEDPDPDPDPDPEPDPDPDPGDGDTGGGDNGGGDTGGGDTGGGDTGGGDTGGDTGGDDGDTGGGDTGGNGDDGVYVSNGCDAIPTCQGDAIQCGIAQEVWKSRCLILEASDNAQSYLDEKTAGVGKLGNEDLDLTEDFGEIDVAEKMNDWANIPNPVVGQCPAPRQINLRLFGTRDLEYTPFCDLASELNPLVIFLFTFLGAVAIARTLTT